MDREHGATESAAFCKRLDFTPAAGAFDAAFDKSEQAAAVTRKLRYAMVGGGRDAFIGAVHRKAMALDGQAELVAGALSSTPGEGARLGPRPRPAPTTATTATGRRCWPTSCARPADERIDFVAIVTPNHVHFPVAQGLRRGRLPRRLRQAAGAHQRAGRRTGRGGARAAASSSASPTTTPATRWCAQARDMVRARRLGERAQGRRRVQPGLARDAARRRRGNKQADWRTDPARSGIAGAIGDIGSHAENLVATVTGLQIESLCADLTTFVPGRRAGRRRQPAAALRRAARAACWSRRRSRPGCENDLRLRVSGTQGTLRLARRRSRTCSLHSPLDGPSRMLTRGTPWLRRGGADGDPHARRAIPRASSRPSRTSTSASSRPSAPRRRAARPIRCEADYPTRGGRRARRALHREDGRVGTQRTKMDADGLRGRPCSLASTWAPRA